MAIYHCAIKNIGRSSGRSAVASAAYRAGEKLTDHETGIVSDYTRKGGVIHSEIMIPEHAPKEYTDRETLWNAVHKIEKSSNARLAREVEVALPVELSYEQKLHVIRSYVKSNFIDEGMCADFAIHDKGDGNPHAHIMLTTRPINKNGKWGAKEKKAYALDENGEKIPVIDPETGEQKVEKKTGRKVWKRMTVEANDWNKREKVELWREAWAEECNRLLEKEQQIDHRSYERQGKEKTATIHEGYKARDMEKKGKVSDRCEINRRIKEKNSLVEKIKAELLKIKSQLQALFAEKEKSSPEPVVSYAVAEKIHNALTNREAMIRRCEDMEKRTKIIKYVELESRIPNEIKETGIDERTASDVRFFYLHQKEFELWNAAPDKKLLFGKTKDDLAASDPDISRVAKVYNYFGGHVPSQLALDNYNRIMEKKAAIMREDRALKERMEEYGKEIEELSAKINTLKGELFVYPDKNAERGDFGRINVDYIDYFPKDWSVQDVIKYSYERDSAWDEQKGSRAWSPENEEEYIDFCRRYAPTPENLSKREKENAEMEKSQRSIEGQGIDKRAAEKITEHKEEPEEQRTVKQQRQRSRGIEI